MTVHEACPRLVVAGLGGDSGKTLVSAGLLLTLAGTGPRSGAFKKGPDYIDASPGHGPRAFKKGPDYIDAAWLSWASGSPARHLDSFLMGFSGVRESFARRASGDGLNLIEGNRGLFDGVDGAGTHSTAELAKALEAPVVLVVNAAKVTRTVAAMVLGCQRLDPGVRLAGVVLNQVHGRRHEQVIREAVASACAIPVLGVLPRAAGETLLPGRHLGLVTPEEHPRVGELRGNLLALLAGRLDVEALIALSRDVPPLARPAPPAPGSREGRGLRVGYLRDSAFTFYYPENLEALEEAGAEVVPHSALAGGGLPPDLDALYIGGGFPETHGAALASSAALLASLRAEAEAGLPIYAECGGLMLLSRAIRFEGRTYPMAGVLPFAVEVCPAPQGHGYTELAVDSPNPFFPEGTALKGHEFHYSRVVLEGEPPPTACAVRRGTGCFGGRDGVLAGNVWAAYTHLHALGTPEWAAGMLAAARGHARRRAHGRPPSAASARPPA